MPNITDIQLVNVQWRNDAQGTWDDIKAYSKTETPTPMTTAVPIGSGGSAVVLFSDITGFDPTSQTSRPLLLNWDDFEIDGETNHNYTIFGDKDGLIATTIKSPLIRYQIRIKTSTPTTVDNPQWNYMMLSAAFSANAFTGAGGTAIATSTPMSCDVGFYFPAYESTDAGQDATAYLMSLLSQAARWRVKSVATVSGAAEVDIIPTAVILGAPKEDVSYGLATIPVTLKVPLNFPTSDTYTITVKFSSNDQEVFLVPGSQTITATITAYMGATEAVIVSQDTDAAFTITFAQPGA